MVRLVAAWFAVVPAFLALSGQVLDFSKGAGEKVESALIRDGISFSKRRLTPWLDVWRGYVNIGVLRREGRVLLVGGAPPELLRKAGISASDIDMVLLTHCHRDAAEGAAELAASGVRVVVPALERQLFEEPEKFWGGDEFRFHAYNYHPSRRIVRQAVKVSRGVRGGDTIEWRGLKVKVLDAPGPTDGGVSYLAADGAIGVAFVGDLISGHGQLWEMHSLLGTRPLPGGGWLMEYHGFLERADEVLSSLDAALAESPRYLVPLHGAVIDKPVEAVGELRRRLSAVIESYCKTSSARWYFAGARPEWPLDRSEMEARLRPLPGWVREVGGTSRALVADDGSAWLIDCAGDVPERVAQAQKRGELGRVECVWITHYHDDHVGSVNRLRREQQCLVVAHESMADILRRPHAYWMPCIHPEPIHVDRVTRDGESWVWKGFKLTAYTFPGQTMYDAALLVERDGQRVLFVGDSLTPGGLDDYCIHNRNLLGEGKGYDRCLSLLEKIGTEGLLLVNEHVEGAFSFDAGTVAALKAELRRRTELLRELLPWDDPNYGLDPLWVRCDPYYQAAEPGATVFWDIVVTNHSRTRRLAVVEANLPPGWQAVSSSGRAWISPGKEGRVRLSAKAPSGSGARRWVVGFSVRYGGRFLSEAAESLVDVGSGGKT